MFFAPRPFRMSEARICGGNHFRAEAERGKIFSRESREPVHAFGIEREAVDADHLPEQFERGRQLRFKKRFEICGVRHGFQRLVRFQNQTSCVTEWSRLRAQQTPRLTTSEQC